MLRFFSFLFFLSAFLHPLHAELLQTEGKGYLESNEGQLVLHLKGTRYEIGRQHGALLKEQIQKNVKTFVDPLQKSPMKAKAYLEDIYKVLAFVPSSFKEEMKGMADGAEIPLEKIYILNLFPEMFHCTGFTVKDAATEDGSLYHARVLDYAVGKSLQSTAVLIVVEPVYGIPFVNVSYAGFIGSVTGMNSEKIAVGEIGGTGYGNWEGIPMSFLMRQILEKATSVEEAKALLSKATRTCEYYYIISDGKTGDSVGVYATPHQIRFIEPGTEYALVIPSNFPKDFNLLGDIGKYCMTSSLIKNSDYQCVLSREDGTVTALIHRQPENCLLLTGFAYEERYPVLVSRILENYGQINANSLMEIIKRPVARDSNLHNAIFHPSTAEIWVSHAGENDEPACDQPYFHYSLDKLLGNN